MDIKQLKYLIALDQTRHFVRRQRNAISLSRRFPCVFAAWKRSWPGVDRRGQRFEGFTPEGERILAWRAPCLPHTMGFRRKPPCKGQVVGELRLGMVPLASVDPMIFIRQLTQKYPELKFSLYSMSSEQIAEGVNSNQLELGICYLNNINTSVFDVIQLPKTKMGLLHDTRRFQLDKTMLTWQDLVNFPLGF
jgi:DNA-binding transcriptional LysR family regulator